ncbi:sigma-70 family RNA polymerase sigma factor [Weissella bombi]|uniref:Sigma-70, region 4 n=1 Tax=Weissella bombi TaxID=1505725 RepID=A0A1C4AWV0_9LACO|nr:sigma-70 family RNA polymerase sigma factor [Weissella bombi]SCB99052.1 hypothetical protein GA0061074_10767 [Weissella bombi]
MKRANKLIQDYFSGWLEADIKCTKLEMAYLHSDDDTKLKEYEEQKAILDELLADLTPVQLKAITMHDKERKPWQAISEELGVKRLVLQKMKSRLIQKLQTRYKFIAPCETSYIYLYGVFVRFGVIRRVALETSYFFKGN